MVRKLIVAAALWATAILAGCGHDAGISANVPGDLNPEPSEIGGALLAPNGVFVRADTGFWHLASSWFTSSAFALAPNVVPVGNGISVTLYSVSEDDAADGEITDAHAVASPQPTNPDGRFAVPLLDGHDIGECGLMLSSGKNDTLTRAFVYSDEQDLSAVSEAVVRSILNFIALNPSVRLCDYSTADIRDLTGLVDYIATDIGGFDVANLNENVYRAALENDEMQRLLDQYAAVP